ncbi:MULTISPECIES: DUF4307 domain-containing protein [Arthrobacter]|uniref:DUF4307 domain-containing protein n=2 Tax=Arthrobacter TaxID=1663 RepID=A0ABU9KKG5_9MICC|nr:DUF4307 domain-containing protein [Arthrobacter sp. YJM1]MDP5227394.1 DUF4307 domain-containing protein [Arthrobacter sp. YJM1]
MKSSLANRYGGQKRPVTRKTKITLIISGVVVACGLAALLNVNVSNVDSVNFNTVSFSANDPSFAEVDFQVSKDRTHEAVCAVKALDNQFAVVGWKYVDIPANAADFGAENGRTTQQRVSIRTESLAVSGVVDSCWSKG